MDNFSYKKKNTNYNYTEITFLNDYIGKNYKAWEHILLKNHYKTSSYIAGGEGEVTFLWI